VDLTVLTILQRFAADYKVLGFLRMTSLSC